MAKCPACANEKDAKRILCVDCWQALRPELVMELIRSGPRSDRRRNAVRAIIADAMKRAAEQLRLDVEFRRQMEE